MDNKNLIEVDDIIKEKINHLTSSTGLSTNDLIGKLIEENESCEKRINQTIEQYKIYKKRELDAFSIGDAISDGICVVDKSGLVIAVNEGYTKITGIKKEDVIGYSIQTLLDKQYFSEAVSLRVLKEKKKIVAMSTIRYNNKKVLITGNPFFDDNGELVQVLTVMRDLTELIQLKERLEETEKESNKYLNELKYFREYELRKDLSSVSEPMEKIKQLINQVAKTDVTILISGETGVGKEVISGEIYKHSNRNDGPFIKVNCAAIPDALLESELFGYEKGAFTGAQNKEKLGMFEMANNGTILLDEIGEMPLKLQTKLLRALQEKEITRVGGTTPIKLDVRVLAATNQNLHEQIKKGYFREDLFYRLNVIPIEVPPLRERKEDIAILTYKFIKKYNKKYNKEKEIITEALILLEEYDWPGNVRELQNVIERLIVTEDNKKITKDSIIGIFGKDKIEYKYLEGDNITLKEAVNLFEKKIIERTLKKHGSTYKAAEVLGITQPTVYRKAKALGIDNW